MSVKVELLSFARIAAMSVRAAGTRHNRILPGLENPCLMEYPMAKKKMPMPKMMGVLTFGPNEVTRINKRRKVRPPIIFATRLAMILFLCVRSSIWVSVEYKHTQLTEKAEFEITNIPISDQMAMVRVRRK